MKKSLTICLVLLAMCMVAFGGVGKSITSETGTGVAVSPDGRASVNHNMDDPGYAEWKASLHHGGQRAVVNSLCNGLVCVQTDEDGDFNIGTAPTHPYPNRSLLFAYPDEPWSTDIRIYVDGAVYNLTDEVGTGCDGQVLYAGQELNSSDITVHYVLVDLEITVIHTPVMFSATTAAIRTRTIVRNMGTSCHSIGVLYVYDTMVDGDDAAELYLGATHLLNETCYDAPYGVNYWDAIPTSGLIVGRGIFSGGDAVTPDHLALGAWGSVYGTCWSAVCSGLPYGDSGVLYQWDPQNVCSGQSRDVATYYGAGEVQVQHGELQLSVSQPDLQCIGGRVQPNPFQLLVNVTNTGVAACSNICVAVSGGNGPGGTSVIEAPNPQCVTGLNPGDNSAVSFTVDLTGTNPDGGCIYYNIVVTSDDCPSNQILEYCVNIPPCHTVQIGDHFCVSFVNGVSQPYTWCSNLTGEPVFSWSPGCNMPAPLCHEDCVPYTGPVSWEPAVYLGSWNGCNWFSTRFHAMDDGCVCVWFESQLSVELTSFGAIAGDGQVALNWSTASETGNDHFEVMRDGIAITTVHAAGSSSAQHNYNWTDTRVANGTTYSYTLVSVDVSGTRDELQTVNATPTASAAQVSEYALRQNYPNPFNPSTEIVFDMKEAGFVSLKVYNLMGQEVSTLTNGTMSQGRHTVSFNATGLPSGVYVYKMEANGFSAQNKMLLMK